MRYNADARHGVEERSSADSAGHFLRLPPKYFWQPCTLSPCQLISHPESISWFLNYVFSSHYQAFLRIAPRSHALNRDVTLGLSTPNQYSYIPRLLLLTWAHAARIQILSGGQAIRWNICAVHTAWTTLLIALSWWPWYKKDGDGVYMYALIQSRKIQTLH